MECKHLQRLQAEYARLLAHKQVHCLDIADDYRYMDPELVEMLEDTVTACLAN
ncbi:cellular communication/signal transduction [Pseudomonas gingeri]|nr:cellular communication/signal transduction [Pseudomonas gingeri]NWA12113.1 cellular communication/signal transduction [Pseudomonas gingeri]NWA57480.1 cellular communication/signal transduction [Pseudomonas gingeri]NWA93823.1 cellular communication/signal transduction [Pseudomonas gingeri]NWB03295.1 cellular communication/signal transduction [Pseudomonas gingeri]